jgi:hypothetical protein
MTVQLVDVLYAVAVILFVVACFGRVGFALPAGLAFFAGAHLVAVCC